MTFAQNINRICKEKGTTLTTVVKQLGLSTSKVSRWNEGSLPKEDVMVLLAQQLDCSVMDFFADEEDIVDTKPRNEDEEDVIRIFRELPRQDRHSVLARLYEYEKKNKRTQQ